MSEKLKELHGVLADELLKRVKDPECKSSDLNVARQFLRDNNIDAVPTEDSPLAKLMEELPFNENKKPVVKN
nr:putative DNA maturase A [uncultured Mediterranean phage uvMED]|tara:strand:+ start:99 stop:314 length:216 start_codon:yes stop_codon:yes gene_type:complete